LKKISQIMELKFKYWKDRNFWVGYMELFPDYWTQGETEEELQSNLRELYTELTSGEFPSPVRQGILKIA
jgi:predicted RNase H-like HicB family nuclease